MNATDFPQRSDRSLPVTLMGEGRDLAFAQGPLVRNEAADSSQLNLREQFLKYLGVALKHRWLILACCISGLVIGFLVTFASTPIYQATATIQIDLVAPKVVKL